MSRNSECWLLSLAILLILATSSSPTSQATTLRNKNGVKTSTFLSPKVELEPGMASIEYYYKIPFPKGHIAIKGFDAEVVDEEGNSVPLHEAYLHHWTVVRSYLRQGVETSSLGSNQSDYMVVRNSGVCETLPQYFGLGAESRKTDSHIPNPCDLYNVTMDEQKLYKERGYIGGVLCCLDKMRCKLKDGYNNGTKRSLFLKYTVKYVDWDSSIVPVKIYILDSTDPWKMSEDSKGLMELHPRQIEYYVESCSAAVANDKCVHTQSASVILPSGGDVIYAVAHQHTGGIGSTLYGHDGRTICSSLPIYGKGQEAGNEVGYIVEMTTCYPQPGFVMIVEGEMITIVSNYSNSQSHTGVMGFFYLAVAAEPLKKPNSIMHAQH
nr:uncharacterized protein LOC109186451 [Ipomoea batatas]